MSVDVTGLDVVVVVVVVGLFVIIVGDCITPCIKNSFLKIK